MATRRLYPDHARLISYFKADAPPFGAQLPSDYDPKKMPYFGELFTYGELQSKFKAYGIDRRIRHWVGSNSVAHCYVETQLWTREPPYTTVC